MSQKKSLARAIKTSRLPFNHFRHILSVLAACCLIVSLSSWSRAEAQKDIRLISAPSATDTAEEKQSEEKLPFPEGDAAAEGISEEALQELVKRAGESNSNSLVVVKNGKLIGQWYFGHKIREHPIRSITESITSLAIGKLIDDHKIASIDVPVSTFYPQWSSGARSVITLRHVLSRTSGLEQSADNTGPDLVKLALDSEVKDKPGTKFVDNDRSACLLAGIVQIASGQDLDTYVAEKFFDPLGIKTYQWQKDAQGQPLSASGLSLTAIDLAKLGQLVVLGGMWEGKQLVSASWLDAATAKPSVNPSYGLAWWLVALPGANQNKQIVGCLARGCLGQTLVVLPKQKLVVVRQISEKGHKSSVDDFNDLPGLAAGLINQPSL